MPQGPHPNHDDLAASIKSLRDELAGLRTELKPVSDAYKAATLGALVLKWGIGVLAGIAAIWTVFAGVPK